MNAVRVGLAQDFGQGVAVKVDVNGVAVAVVRIDETLYAIADRCSHANISLSEGEVHCGKKELECWKHGSAFSLETGVPSTFPATQPVEVFSVSTNGDEVFVTRRAENGEAS
ncbi:MAG: non-heme iron oxygenase ferredoxin subunit [Actinomycetes bacterium]